MLLSANRCRVMASQWNLIQVRISRGVLDGPADSGVLNLNVKWIHLIVGIAWIGASFYFNWLEGNLERQKAGLNKGVAGDLWAVHGGGFYLSRSSKWRRKTAGNASLVQMGSLSDLDYRLHAFGVGVLYVANALHD